MRNPIIAFTLSILLSVQAQSHARLKVSSGIFPRSTNSGIKIGPCGNLPRVVSPPTLNAGSTLTVTWEETIDHPGRFEFYFSKAGEANFVLLKTVQDTQNGSGGLPHQYTTDIILPNETCTNCTLQMIQVMTENPASPSLYFSCADLILVPGGSAPPTPTPNPQNQPPPAPEESCH